MLDENPNLDDSAVALLDGLSPKQEQAIVELLNQPSRLDKIQKKLAAVGGCWTCANAMGEVMILCDDEPQPPPRVCPECGKVRARVMIRLTTPAPAPAGDAGGERP